MGKVQEFVHVEYRLSPAAHKVHRLSTSVSQADATVSEAIANHCAA